MFVHCIEHGIRLHSTKAIASYTSKLFDVDAVTENDKHLEDSVFIVVIWRCSSSLVFIFVVCERQCDNDFGEVTPIEQNSAELTVGKKRRTSKIKLSHNFSSTRHERT